jgi:hypothetical protein
MKSKEGRVSNLFGKENANDYIRKNERIHHIDNDVFISHRDCKPFINSLRAK